MNNVVTTNSSVNSDVTISINFAELEKDLQSVKKQLLLKRNMGLLGGVLCAAELMFSYDTKTACTNGRYIKFNPDFWISLHNEHKLFLLAHELFHVKFINE